MVNFPSVSIRGAFEFGRARALWKDGLLRVFGFDGLLLETIAERPVKKAGYLLAWDVRTARGDITIRSKCITCGGRKWWRIVFMPSDELWSL